MRSSQVKKRCEQMNCTNNDFDVIGSVVVPLLLFFLGRYTSYRSDLRVSRKELNDNFYRPFVFLFKDTRRTRACYFIDYPEEIREKLTALIMDNEATFSPENRDLINEFYMAYVGITDSLKRGESVSNKDILYLEVRVNSLYEEINKNYVRNTRILSCSYPKRIWYFISETCPCIKDGINKFNKIITGIVKHK